jgi:ABC-2 type transport system ATP-binding protein
VNRRLLSSVVRQLKESGTTILFSTHQMEQAEDLCDQVLLIHKGEKVLDETMSQIHSRFDPRTILAQPANSIDAATQALKVVAGIESMRWSLEQKSFEIRLLEGVDPQLAMVDFMRATPLRRVELQRATLDDVFVKLVGDSVTKFEATSATEQVQVTHG